MILLNTKYVLVKGKCSSLPVALKDPAGRCGCSGRGPFCGCIAAQRTGEQWFGRANS